ncbi:hypothetical protein GCM10011297_09590 [Bacterioplanes sanyensis]|uniref:FecR family protein n=1 Tax=Bacterioplanes sanyensis TaxID=1249553 RepID=UPI001676E8BB|nr:FecR family protein [Bacterioplanes sanyensis]GGY38504.1 hypothetical protein GCM10011297_09590 [Bacterioplanes sanyensis]
MFIRMHRFLILLLALGWLPAQAAELAGRVIMVRGEAQAVSANGEIRSLQRRDAVYVTDTLRTGSDSRVQIRFVDNALLALKGNSELRISTYEMNAEQTGGTILMELVEGGFRTLTGKIGKGEQSDYEVRTPVASIGIRGTLYSLLWQQQSLMAGVWEGGIALSSDIGQFELGSGADFNFAVLDDSGFSGLLNPPSALQDPAPQAAAAASRRPTPVNVEEDQGGTDDNRMAVAPDNSAEVTENAMEDAATITLADVNERDEDGRSDAQTSDTSGNEDDATTDTDLDSQANDGSADTQIDSQSNDATSSDESLDTADTGTDVTATNSAQADSNSVDKTSVPAIEDDTNNNDLAATDSEAATPVTETTGKEEPALNPLEREEEAATEDQFEIRDENDNPVNPGDDVTPPDPTDPNEPTDPTDPTEPNDNLSPDPRLSNEEYEVLLTNGFVGAVGSQGEQRGGVAIPLGEQEPVFVIQSGGEDERLGVVRYDGSSVVREQPLPGVEWGIWAGTSEQPVKSYPDPSNPEQFEPRDGKVLWITAEPIRVADMAGLYGTVDYSASAAGAAFLGFNDKDQSLNRVDGQFTVDFDTGSVSNGQLAALFGDADVWKIEFAGDIRIGEENAPVLNAILSNGERNGLLIDLEASEFGGVLVAPDAEAFGGMFSLQDLEGGDANGVVVWPLQNRR